MYIRKGKGSVTMKYSETGFRPLYHNFCIFPINESVKAVAENFPGFKEADGVLTYGYCDREAGFTLEILCCVKRIDDEQFAFADPSEEARGMIRIGAVADEEYIFIEYGDAPLKNNFKENLEMISCYDADEAVETSRTFDFLDEFRHELYPDDVLVLIAKVGLNPERCWTRITGLGDECIIGTLLNEPDQEFGYHAGDTIAFFLYEDNEGKKHLISNMNASMKITAEDLEGGDMLRGAIKIFNEERSREHLIDVLELLRDSYIWIPCNAITSEEDQKRLKEMISKAEGDFEALKGTTFSNQDALRLVPDILQNGDDFFFPVFTSDREMGEYGAHFSKIEKHFLEAIQLARGNDKNVKGIVIDAFSESMIIHKELFDIIEEMKSRL